ncbi:hypothetical protein GQ457_16G017150 [Hibiscus cannabinus]
MDMNSLRVDYQQLFLVFKNDGLGETLVQWKKGINKLKHEAVKWKRNFKANGRPKCKEIEFPDPKVKEGDKEKDNDKKMVVAQAWEATQQVADLADIAMALSQNIDSTSDYGGKLTRKIEGYLNDDKLMIHYFQDSLTGPAMLKYNLHWLRVNSPMFHDTLLNTYYEKMFGNLRENFEDLIVIGE